MHPVYQFRNICKLHLSLLPSSLFRPSPAAGTARRCGLLACVVEQLRCSLAVYRVQSRQKNWCKTRQTLVLHTRHGKWRHVLPPLGIPRCFEVALSSVKKFVYRYNARLGQLSQRSHISWKDIGFLICSPHTEDLLAIMKNDIVHSRCTQMYATSKNTFLGTHYASVGNLSMQ